MRSFLGILPLLLGYSHVCWAQSKCYYPNGSEAKGDSPCDPNAAVSACCGSNSGIKCLTNNLCFGGDGDLIRGSCTDQSWNSPECAQYCLSEALGGTNLISCSNVSTSNSYCCDGHRAFCCDSGVSRFTVLPVNPQTWATWAASQFALVPTTPVSVSSPSSSLSISSPTTSITSSAGTTTSKTSSPSSAITSTATSTSLPTAAQSTPATPPSSGLPLAAQIGIGAGAGVLAIAIAAVGWLLFKLRQKNKRLLAAQQQQQQSQGRDDDKHWVPPGAGGGDWGYQYGGGYGSGSDNTESVKHVCEVHGQGAVFELPVPRYELPANPGPVPVRSMRRAR